MSAAFAAVGRATVTTRSPCARVSARSLKGWCSTVLGCGPEGAQPSATSAIANSRDSRAREEPSQPTGDDILAGHLLRNVAMTLVASDRASRSAERKDHG